MIARPLDLSYEELAKLADHCKRNYKRNWLDRYIKILGVKPIVAGNLDATIIEIVSNRTSYRQKAWRLQKLFDKERES